MGRRGVTTAREAKLRGAKPASLPVKAPAQTKTRSPSHKEVVYQVMAYWRAKKAGKKEICLEFREIKLLITFVTASFGSRLPLLGNRRSKG